MKTHDNVENVIYARKGYYKGVECLVTHYHRGEVWLEDYPVKVGNKVVDYGCWVPNDAVQYGGGQAAPATQNQQKPTRNRKRKKKATVSKPKAGDDIK